MKLTKKLETLLLHAVKQAGSYDPNEALPFIEEQLTGDEYKTGVAFLTWVNAGNNDPLDDGWPANERSFGHGNIQERFKEFKAAAKK